MGKFSDIPILVGTCVSSKISTFTKAQTHTSCFTVFIRTLAWYLDYWSYLLLRLKVVNLTTTLTFVV